MEQKLPGPVPLRVEPRYLDQLRLARFREYAEVWAQKDFDRIGAVAWKRISGSDQKSATASFTASLHATAMLKFTRDMLKELR